MFLMAAIFQIVSLCMFNPGALVKEQHLIANSVLISNIKFCLFKKKKNVTNTRKKHNNVSYFSPNMATLEPVDTLAPYSEQPCVQSDVIWCVFFWILNVERTGRRILRSYSFIHEKPESTLQYQ